MNRRIVLLIVLLVLGGLAWWLSQRGNATTLDKPLSDFSIPDTSRVTRVFITDKQGATVDLQRASKGWKVNGTYEARQVQVDLILKTFLRIEVKSPVPKSAEAMTLRTMGSSATKVEIYEGSDRPSKIWIVGHATKDHFGTYMVLEKPDEGRSSAPFVMGLGGFTGILNTRFPTNVDQWRSTNVFRNRDLQELASVEVEHVDRPLMSYRIENGPDGTPKLSTLSGKPLPMDTTLTKGALLPYRSFDYEFIDREMKKASRDSLLAIKPNFIIRTTARSGDVRTMKLWYMPYKGEPSEFDEPQLLHDAMRMYALVEDTLIVAVQRRFTDIMTQPASALMP